MPWHDDAGLLGAGKDMHHAAPRRRRRIETVSPGDQARMVPSMGTLNHFQCAEANSVVSVFALSHIHTVAELNEIIIHFLAKKCMRCPEHAANSTSVNLVRSYLFAGESV